MYGNNADSRFSCKGCKHEWAVPSHERCIGCARMYLDHYEKAILQMTRKSLKLLFTI